MESPKEIALRVIAQVPDDATIDDIFAKLYVIQRIEQGMQASREGRVTSHADVVARFSADATTLD